MACWTRSSVSARSRSGLLTALETVWRETPARSATSASVGGSPDVRALVRDTVTTPCHLLIVPSPTGAL